MTIFLLPSKPLKNRRELPPVPAVYYCCSGLKVLYVGKAKDLHERWNSRRYGDHHKLQELRRYRNVRIYWTEVNPLWLSHKEAKEIHRLKPKLNRRNELPNPFFSFLETVYGVVFWCLMTVGIWYLYQWVVR